MMGWKERFRTKMQEAAVIEARRKEQHVAKLGKKEAELWTGPVVTVRLSPFRGPKGQSRELGEIAARGAAHGYRFVNLSGRDSMDATFMKDTPTAPVDGLSLQL